MTTQKWRAMSAEQRRVWIAEKLDDKFKLCPIHHQHECCGRGRIPDYERDLNACAEMVSTLDDDGTRTYFLDILSDVIPSQYEDGDHHLETMARMNFAEVNATAPQRCEAFALAVEPETGEK